MNNGITYDAFGNPINPSATQPTQQLAGTPATQNLGGYEDPTKSNTDSDFDKDFGTAFDKYSQSGDFDELGQGTYVVDLTDATLKLNKQDKEMVTFKFKVSSSDTQGAADRLAFINLNLRPYEGSGFSPKLGTFIELYAEATGAAPLVAKETVKNILKNFITNKKLTPKVELGLKSAGTLTITDKVFDLNGTDKKYKERVFKAFPKANV